MLAMFAGMVAVSPMGQERISLMLAELQEDQSINRQRMMEDGVDNSSMTRIYLWQGAWILWKEHPLLGVGFGAFPEKVQALSDRGEIGPILVNVHAHNVVLHWLAAQGAVGALALLFLFAQPWLAAPSWRHPGTPWTQARLVMLATLMTGMTEVNLGWDAMMTAFSVCLVLAMAPPMGSKT